MLTVLCSCSYGHSLLSIRLYSPTSRTGEPGRNIKSLSTDYEFASYGSFASSALAGQSLARNIMGTVFPLFTNQLYDGELLYSLRLKNTSLQLCSYQL